jgi:hypothetical protein
VGAAIVLFICSGGHICCSCGDWPFKTIAFVESEQEKFRYTPRSDFHVSVNGLMHLLVEVQSDKHQYDRYRMLLQAACVARLGRMLYDNPFIVVALYIENSGRVTRYFVFQRDGTDSTVCTFESKRSCVLTGSPRFPMSRNPKTGMNRSSCSRPCSKFTTSYQ